MPGWHKLAEQTARRLVFPTRSLWSKANPCPLEVACVEVAILHAMGELEQYSSRDLQARWGQSWRFVARALKLAQIQGLECNAWPERDTFGTHSVSNGGTLKPSKSGQLESKSGRFRDGFGTVSGQIRDYARDPYLDLDADADLPLPPTPQRGEAQPARPLASVLAEAWAASEHLRPGAKGPGLAPVVPLEWHEVDASEWVRALEAYLQGTRDGSPGRWKPCAQSWGKWLEHGQAVLQWVRDPAMDEPSMGRRYVERDRRRDEETSRRMERANRFAYKGPARVDASQGGKAPQPAGAPGDPAGSEDDPYSLDYLS